MKTSIAKISVLAIVAVAFLSADAMALSKRRYFPSLQHRSQLELRIGVRDDTHFDRFYEYNVIDREGLGNMVVTVGYNYWADEHTAFNISAKVLAAETVDKYDEFGVYTSDFSVVALFLGARQYFHRPGSHAPLRPYVAISGGPVIGSHTCSEVGFECLAETKTIAAAGMHLGGGFDVVAGRHIMFGLNAGYNLLTDFSEPVGGHVNYSGSEFGASIGFIF